MVGGDCLERGPNIKESLPVHKHQLLVTGLSGVTSHHRVCPRIHCVGVARIHVPDLGAKLGLRIVHERFGWRLHSENRCTSPAWAYISPAQESTPADFTRLEAEVWRRQG